MYYSVKHTKYRTPDSPILFLKQNRCSPGCPEVPCTHTDQPSPTFWPLGLKGVSLHAWPGNRFVTNERSTVRGSQPSHGTLRNFFHSRLSSGSRSLPVRALWKLGLEPGPQPTAPGPRLCPIAGEHRSRRHRLFRLRRQAATGNKWAFRKLEGVSC